MTMYQFMVNAFYMLCGVACVAASVVIVYIVLNVLFRALRRGGGNNGRYLDRRRIAFARRAGDRLRVRAILSGHFRRR